MDMLETIDGYLFSIVYEGLIFAFLFWAITYITIESTSLSGAIRAALLAEAIGNLPYLAGLPAQSAPGALGALISGIVFCWLILRVGELTAGKAVYGVAMTYFVLVAMVSCS